MKRASEVIAKELLSLSERAPSEDEIVARELERELEARAARGQAYSAAFLKALPEAIVHAPMATFERTRGNEQAYRLAMNLKPGESMLLHGSPGIGKTHLAVLAAHRLSRDHGARAHFWVWPELVARLRDWRNTDRAPSISSPDVLVVDDFDKGAVTEFVYERAYDILQRVMRNQTTIVTTNRDPARTAMRFGMGDRENTEAFVSRFRLFRSAGITGKDRRAPRA